MRIPYSNFDCVQTEQIHIFSVFCDCREKKAKIKKKPRFYCKMRVGKQTQKDRMHRIYCARISFNVQLLNFDSLHSSTLCLHICLTLLFPHRMLQADYEALWWWKICMHKRRNWNAGKHTTTTSTANILQGTHTHILSHRFA